ncbi:sodium-independent sulfate anion transporter-like [Amyelois transitella]|uniref:sodium-independent sulfate anion transporter-like n=1 Tax=Amyelois transitella TaxID=680683 RepID=UPI00298FA5CC|nr:sodium-independent sulfate anion transporter-like [Amyelois transitella]
MTVNTTRRAIRKELKRCAQNVCSVKTLKKRLPVLVWLPNYSVDYCFQDIIAGVTVGLTAIPQGIAYAVIAGLSPEYGLYASLTSGIVYMIFGSCKSVTVGPTAILSSMVARYVVDYSADFAILASFLSGVVQLLLGIFRLGFLIEFISVPVINGFTTAAAMQIAAAQLKSYFGLQGPSGNTFGESAYYFFLNIKSAKLWDPILSTLTIIALLLLKKMGDGCKRSDNIIRQLRWFFSLSRNAIVVIFGMIIAYIIKTTLYIEPLELIGDIGNGLPEIGPPPFSTTVGNETLNFIDMLTVLGAKSIVLPLVAVLETIAISKAFADGDPVDATQELIAIGLCNVVGSYAKSMPITGSFTRTALNYASGVQTQAGGVTKILIIIAALTMFTSTFYYIPKASLAGLIITAMFSMIDYSAMIRLWRHTKREFFLFFITTTFCLFIGLEYGILVGISIEAAMLLYKSARPKLKVEHMKSVQGELLIIPLSDSVAYCAAEHVRRIVITASFNSDIESVIVVDGANVKRMDITATEHLMSAVRDFEKKSRKIIFANFNSEIKNLCLDINPKVASYFVTIPNVLDIAEVIQKEV